MKKLSRVERNLVVDICFRVKIWEHINVEEAKKLQKLLAKLGVLPR